MTADPTRLIVDKPENPLAFPGDKWTPDNQDVSEGMFLRDYFAAKAMQSLVAHDSCTNPESDSIPRAAYAIADAMLKARAL